MHRFRQYLTYLTGFLLGLLSPPSVSAQSSAPSPYLGQLNDAFQTLVMLALGLVGIASLAMILYSGYRYLSAGANKDAATSARLTLTYAVIGLVIAVSAWLILNLIGTFLGVDFRLFDICIDSANC